MQAVEPSQRLCSTRANRLTLAFLLLAVLVIGVVSMPAEVYEGDPSAVRMEAAFLVAGIENYESQKQELMADGTND